MRNIIDKFLKNVKSNERDTYVNCFEPILPLYLKPILKSKKGTTYIYSIFIKNSDVPTCHAKWNNIFEIQESEWEVIHSWVFDITNDPYLHWLQIRIIHRILGTNVLLYKDFRNANIFFLQSGK